MTAQPAIPGAATKPAAYAHLGGDAPGAALPRVTLFAMYPPEGTQGGGVILRDLLEKYPADRLQWLSRSPSPGRWRTEVRRAAFPGRLRGQSLLKPDLLRRVAEQIEAALMAPWIFREAERFESDVIWLVLDAAVVPIARRLLRSYRGPVHISVHDDPSIVWRLESGGAPRNGVRDLEQVVGGATSLDVISERMRRRFQGCTQADIAVLTRGCRTGGEARPPTQVPSPARILMGGWYGPDTGNARGLFEAFRQLRARREVELHLVDRRLAGAAEEGVTVYEWMDPPVFEKLLEDTAAGFARDPMDTAGRAFAASSFPTKVVTYIGAGKPFVYHGPRDSTVGDLLSSYRCGVIVESDDPAELASAFDTILGDEYPAYAAECLRAAREVFDLNGLRETLNRMLVVTARTARR